MSGFECSRVVKANLRLGANGLAGTSLHCQETFIKKVRRMFEQIEENILENQYEFLSEQDMQDMGWNEHLG